MLSGRSAPLAFAGPDWGATRELVRLQPAAAWARGQRSSVATIINPSTNRQLPASRGSSSPAPILCSVMRTVLAVFRRVGLASRRFSQICVYSPPFPYWPIFGHILMDHFGVNRTRYPPAHETIAAEESHRWRRRGFRSVPHGPRSFSRRTASRPVYSLQCGDGRATGSRCSSAYERSTNSKSNRSAFGSASSSCSCSHPGGVDNAHKLPHFATSQWAPDGGALCSHRAAKK